MRQDIKREMLEYFKKISNRTPQENRFLLHLETEVEYFDVASLSRDDIYDIGYDAEHVSDEQMEGLARKLGDSYSDYGDLWEDLRNNLDRLKIPMLL